MAVLLCDLPGMVTKEGKQKMNGAVKHERQSEEVIWYRTYESQL